jgi:hypothetical protein
MKSVREPPENLMVTLCASPLNVAHGIQAAAAARVVEAITAVADAGRFVIPFQSGQAPTANLRLKANALPFSGLV